jgi:hypothetical protein
MWVRGETETGSGAKQEPKDGMPDSLGASPFERAILSVAFLGEDHQ